MSAVADVSKGSHRYRVLLLSLALLVGLQSVAQAWSWSPLAVAFAGAVVMATMLWRVYDRLLAFGIGVALMLLAIVGGLAVSSSFSTAISGSPFHAPFYVYFSATVLRQVLGAKQVTEDTVLGSACAYLLVSLAFASAYEAVESFSPGAIAGLVREGGGTIFAQLSYFSLVTLTTLGYGDLAPVHPFCQSLAILETVIGAMFPALIVARIIAVQSSSGDSPFSHPEPELSREGIVARALFFFLPTAVLALPWLERSALGSFAVSAILTALMITGVYFVTGRRSVLVVGIGMALAAEGLRVVGPELLELAIGIEVLLIAGVVVGMSRWCLQQQQVTTSVVLAAVCLYWLIGLGFSGVFQMIERVSPGTLEPDGPGVVGDLIYYSYMTLTTTGYGDFVPVNDLTRLLASIEAFVGVFYPAIVIARLVSLYGARE